VRCRSSNPAGTLKFLNTQHTYTGSTTVSAGTLQLANAPAAITNSTIAGMNLWLDANNPATLNTSTNGAAVTFWNDLSPFSRNFTTSGLIANQPLYETNLTTNGLSAVRFNGAATPSASFMYNLSAANANTQNIFVVNSFQGIAQKALAGMIGRYPNNNDFGLRYENNAWGRLAGASNVKQPLAAASSAPIPSPWAA
jgi:autotransporter-associated beta strand protein